MSQSYSSNCFSTANVIETDMQNIENNFDALRSMFSGSSAPTSPDNGQLWYDTGSSMIKLRYNSSWVNVFNCSKGIVINTGAITSAHIATSAVDANRLASGAALGNIGSSGITGGYIAGGQIAQVHLKTTYGEVSGGSGVRANYTLPGGTYGFYPQVKMSDTETRVWQATMCMNYPNGSQNAAGWTSYVTSITLYAESGTMYALQRYITSSGEIFWIFVLREKDSGKVLSMWMGPDHPCFGNGADPERVPHPFPDYNPDKHEILLFNPSPDEVDDLREYMEDNGHDSLIDAFRQLYDLSDLREAAWPTKPVTVGLPRKTRDGKRLGPVPMKKVIPRHPNIRPVRPMRKISGK